MPVNMATGRDDTARVIAARQIEGLRKMTPAQKLAIAGALSRNVRQLALAGIRLRHPGISEHEAKLRLAAMSVDRATMLRAFGWAPERPSS
jgi:hypothetical protein